jgi:hypothetical protein
MQTKPPAKSQCHYKTQQASENTNEKTVKDAGGPNSASKDKAHNQSQKHLKPRHQLGADSRGKVIDGILVSSAKFMG